jgi:hypothetical protein
MTVFWWTLFALQNQKRIVQKLKCVILGAREARGKGTHQPRLHAAKKLFRGADRFYAEG